MTVHPMYSPVELDFTGPARPIPADVVPLRARFRHEDGGEVVVPGFWDGDDRYLVRFSPEREGAWTWRTESDEESLAGRSGSLSVRGAQGHGPVRPAHMFHFAHADGTPFRPVGATAYNWLHQAEPLFGQTPGVLAEAGFDKFRFMVFPQAGGHIEHFPDLLPFEKDENGEWDVSRPVIAFFRRLDDAVRMLGAHGIEADVLLFNSYDGGRFGLDGLTEVQDAAYLRYVMARLSAFPNVWWTLCNEFDLLTDRPSARWDRMGEILQAEDPHDHPRSIHNWMELHDHNRPWITHASIQNGSATTHFGRASLYRDAYRKPIVLDEIKYEGDIADRWGNLTGRELVHQFWVATVSGCYASHGESFLLPNGSLHMVQGGPLQGESPARLGFLRRILDDLVVPGLDPIDKWDDPAYVAGQPRVQYVQYLGVPDADTWVFRLPQGNKGERLHVGDEFIVDLIRTWEMTVTSAGRHRLTDVHRNEAFAAASDPVALPQGEPLALRITRVV